MPSTLQGQCEGNGSSCPSTSDPELVAVQGAGAEIYQGPQAPASPVFSLPEAPPSGTPEGELRLGEEGGGRWG